MTTVKKKNSNKSITPMSVQEFKMWIKGLSDFQDDNWSPNKSQWEHIRLLIDSLSDNVVVSRPQQQAQPMIRQPAGPAMGETVGEANNYASAQPVQQRFLGGAGSRPATTGERDEFGHPVLAPIGPGQSDFI